MNLSHTVEPWRRKDAGAMVLVAVEIEKAVRRRAER